MKAVVTLGSQAGPPVGYWNLGPGRAGRRGPGGHLTSGPHVPHRPLLGSVHFLLLVFLKVPLLLGMGATGFSGASPQSSSEAC